MIRDEFLRRLRAELLNSVSDSVIREQISYYYSYIQDGISAGKTEEAVVSELGDVRLIARSIMDAAEAGGDRVAATTPFRYSEEEINYNTDEEDLAYQGAQQDSVYTEEPFQSFGQQSERETRYQSREESADGQTVENESRGRAERPFMPGAHFYQMGNAGCLITAVLLFLLLYGLMVLIGGVFRLLSPILMPLLVVLVLLWFFKGIMDN